VVPRAIARVGSAGLNALEVIRFGGLATGERPSAYEVVSEQRVYRLRHYFPGGQPGPPVLLVPPPMLATEIYDVAPATSAVRILADHGADPWVVDFGAPEREEGGLGRTLTDHVLAVSDAIERVRAATGRDVHLTGYSQGGMFCYQAAAYRRGAGIDSVITFGSPVDTHSGMPLGVPDYLASAAAELLTESELGRAVLERVALPAWAARTVFQLLDPVKTLRGRLDFLRQLHDRDALLRREGQRRFLGAEGWVAWPGPALADFLRQFIAHNRMLQGGFIIDGRLVTLADIACPVLSFVGSVDEIAPAPGVHAIRRAAPRADVHEVVMDAGHFGLVIGSKAAALTWPTVAAWTRWREGGAPLPEAVVAVPAGTVSAGDPDEAPPPEVRTRVGYALELASGAGTQFARSALREARQGARTVRELASEAATELPRLARLGQLRPGTRISIGSLLAQRRRRDPDGVFFLFSGRAYSVRDADERIDAAVRGLIALGVRRGEHVGVLMDTRPGALILTVAISRLGAVSVLLRPDGDVARETELGQVSRVITEDLEAAGTARLPDWYRPDPGRASDLAFIVFTGEGERTRVSRITNGRWAMSAFGTASSAALSAADTVYSVAPLHHPSGLMMSIGGAIAGDARLALATTFDPSTFWEEIRRYGVTVASYTWTMLHDIVSAPPHPAERHHPVRLFIGSGMPRGLWRRVERRLAPARVLEFYASTEAGAILVNLSGAKPGSMGRALPGSTPERIVAYDIVSRRLEISADGLARQCGTDEIGMLLVRGESSSAVPLRGVFEADDAWLATGDLFRRDADGDYWRIDAVADVIATAAGPVLPGPVRDALGDLPAVGLAVAYGVPAPSASAEPSAAAGQSGDAEADTEVVVAAVTLLEGHELDGADLTAALAALPPSQRPDFVRVVDEIPVTTWFRPMTAPLRAAGIPSANAWRLDPASGEYRLS
jgi:putative long chain acyl-CoA synthase